MKKIFIPVLYSLLTLGILSGFNHPLYVSVSQIKYNDEAKSLEIAIKIFVDDLETALMDQGIDNLYLGLEKEAPLADEHVSEYLLKHLKISINGKEAAGMFIGKEVVDDVIWSYIEVHEAAYPTDLSVDNTLLLSSIEDQQNIVHVQVNGKEKSLRLFKGRTKEVLNF